jgi:hypothetical protein
MKNHLKVEFMAIKKTEWSKEQHLHFIGRLMDLLNQYGLEAAPISERMTEEEAIKSLNIESSG